MKKVNVRFIVIAIIILLIAVFTIQNSTMVDVKLLFWKISIPRVFLILGCFSLGVGLGLFYGGGKKA